MKNVKISVIAFIVGMILVTVSQDYTTEKLIALVLCFTSFPIILANFAENFFNTHR